MSTLHTATHQIYRYTSRWLVIILAIVTILLLTSQVVPFEIVGAVLGVIAIVLSAVLIIERNSIATLPNEPVEQTRATDPFGNAGAVSSPGSQTGLRFGR